MSTDLNALSDVKKWNGLRAIGMVLLDAWIAESKAPVRMIMQVHDELVFEVASEAVDDVTPRIRERMCGAAALAVPLVVDVGVGDNWDEVH